LARDDRFRPRAACNGRWRKDREIGVAADEPIETDLAIPDRRELAAQQTWRGTVLGRRCEGVDNADARLTRKRRAEIVEQGVTLFHLVRHVNQNRNVARVPWRLRSVGITAADPNVLQSELARPRAQALQILGDDVFCDDAALGSDNRRQP